MPIVLSRRVTAFLVATLAAAGCQAATFRFGSADAEHEQSCRALADSRVVVAAAIGTLYGDEPSFARVREGVAATSRDLGVADTSAPASEGLARLLPLAQRVDRDARTLVERRPVLARTAASLKAISDGSGDLLQATETLMSLMLQDAESPATISAVGQLVMLSQRLGRSADTFMSLQGIRPESVFLLGKDLKTSRVILDGLADGNSELRLHPARTSAGRAQVAKSKEVLATMQAQAQGMLADLKDLVAAREAQAQLQLDADALGHGLALMCAGTDAGGSTPWRMPAPAPAPSVPSSR